MAQKHWTPSEVDFIKQHHEEMTYKELAAALGRSEASVYAQCYKMGVKCPRSKTRELNIYRLLHNGNQIDKGTVPELCKEWGYEPAYLYTAAVRGNKYDLGEGKMFKVMLIYRDFDQKGWGS